MTLEFVLADCINLALKLHYDHFVFVLQMKENRSMISWNGFTQMEFVLMKLNYQMEGNLKSYGGALLDYLIGELHLLTASIFPQ